MRIKENGVIALCLGGGLLVLGIALILSKIFVGILSACIGLVVIISALKISDPFVDKCLLLIEEYEKGTGAATLSCKEVIRSILVKMTKKETVEPSTEKCNMALASLCFLLLSSGDYHIYTGTINPVGQGPSLMLVFRKSSKWLLDNGVISKDDYDEKCKALEDSIRFVG